MKTTASHPVFDEWCEVTSCHGVIDWARAATVCAKRFWLLAMAVCFCVTCWQTSEVFKDYFQESSYSSSVWLTPENGMQFPDVTICNFNRVRRSAISEVGLSNRALSYAFGSLRVFYDLSIKSKNLTPYENEWQNFVEKNASLGDVKTLLKTLGPLCETTFWKCSFNGEIFPCCQYVTEVVNSYGKCFKITPPVTSTERYPIQTTPGASNGLKITIDPQLHEYPSDLVENNFLEEGFLVSPSYLYEPLLPNPIGVAPGRHAYIKLKPKVETFAQPSYPVAPLPCQRNPKLTYLNETYTKQNCFVDCYLGQNIRKCGCVLLFEIQNRSVPICNYTTARSCIFSVQAVTNRTEADDCLNGCLAPCSDTLTVTAAISSVKLPAPSLYETMKDTLSQIGINFDKITSMPITLDVYFPNMEIIVIETSETTPVFTLLANLGGQLGLWLGISSVTVVQAIYYVVYWLCNRKSK